jgi:hypothetical protein
MILSTNSVYYGDNSCFHRDKYLSNWKDGTRREDSGEDEGEKRNEVWWLQVNMSLIYVKV